MMSTEGPWPIEQEPLWKSREHLQAFIRSGFTKASLIPIGALAIVITGVVIGWWELVDLDQPFDGLLFGLWIGMVLSVAWRFELRRDLVLGFVAALGGFVIEWWGTSTELWTYFTGETPPLWIIPAWPVAALATERLTYLLDRSLPKLPRKIWTVLYAVLIPAFIVWMTWYMHPAWTSLSSRIVFAIMIGVLISTSTTRHDVQLFIMGTILGWWLEYWGTTRQCWTYYTAQTPPLVTALAHGFASIAFWRAAHVIHGAWEIAKAIRRRQPLKA